MYEKLKKAAAERGLVCIEDADMSKYTSFGTGGRASLLTEPDSIEALEELLLACREDETVPVVLGNGTNVLVRDEGIDGVVIRLGEAFSKAEYCGNNILRARAGATLKSLCCLALEYGQSGLEFACGIPGTVGGAVYMNAGAFGGEMKDVVMVANHMDLKGNRGSFQGEELDFSYRHSAYEGSELIITSVILQLKSDKPEAIKYRMDSVFERRRAKQPLEFKSAGSTFKRPKGAFAGALIEECGLKGSSVGGAKVSEKHAGFIVNVGGATSSDILRLIDEVKERVFKEKGIELEPEIRII